MNLSPRNLQDPDLAAARGRAAAASGASTRPSLTFEITENVIMSDPARAMESLTRLHEMGVRLAIDDFGTGYSSLGYLRRLPVDELKIDRSFVIGLGTGQDEVVVRSTIDLAHNLGLSVVAEGVESLAVQERLLALGCDAAQGFFIGAPAGADATRQWIAARQTRPGAVPAFRCSPDLAPLPARHNLPAHTRRRPGIGVAERARRGRLPELAIAGTHNLATRIGATRRFTRPPPSPAK